MRCVRVVIASFGLTPMAMPLAIAQHDAHPAGHARAKHAPTLGTIVFPNSGSAAAQEPFLRGIALLHSFEYEEAADAFRVAQRADPAFALAYWGEALTYSHVLWGMENLRASRAALQRLAPSAADRLAKARTSRERSYGAAVEAFYVDAPQAQRVRAYADSLRRHASAAPDDHEAAAFAAHALMLASFNADGAERETLSREAIALAQRVVQANPEHPGATHYLIHLFDTPAMAKDGLAWARAYDQIAPDAEHALHMPSHIYLQLGLWDDVATSNERAWAASRASTTNAADLDWHAFSWLQYAYLQQGRYTAARGLIDTARALLGGARGQYPDGSVALTRLEFQYASETGRWSAQSIPRPRFGSAQPASDRERMLRLQSSYWVGIDALQRRDTATYAVVTAAWLARADSLRSGLSRRPLFASGALQFEALLARARGDRARYLELLTEAAEQERKMQAFVGPPERLFSLEFLGAELLADGRHTESARAYEDVLRLCPNRSQALLGLAHAKSAAGDRAGAAEVFARLRANWARADADVTSQLQN